LKWNQTALLPIAVAVAFRRLPFQHGTFPGEGMVGIGVACRESIAWNLVWLLKSGGVILMVPISNAAVRQVLGA
jgi:hypothetical protein